MVIAHNISALNTYKSLGIAGGKADNSMEKLSSGYKINKAADDAAGLSISEKMRSQIRGLNQASTNAENGVSMIQTAEGALNEQHAILQRMRELAVQAATDTNAEEDRSALQSEMAQLTSEINRIGATTQFNGMNILDGTKTVQYSGGTASNVTVGGVKFEAKSAKENLDGITFKIASVTADSNSIEQSKDGKTITINLTATDAASGKAANAVNNLLEKVSTGRKFTATAEGAATAAASGAATANYAAMTKGEDNSVYFHVGANSNQVINTEFNDMQALSLGITSIVAGTSEDSAFVNVENVNNGTQTNNVQFSLNISSREGANKAIDYIDEAIKKVSNERSKYGAIQNRLEYTINNLNTTAENMTAAESTIRDVDMADEMMEYTKNNILQQAAQAMLVQANARPQQALQLLQ